MLVFYRQKYIWSMIALAAALRLILPTQELMQQAMLHWFGPYAEQIQVVASGNLPYNQAQLARKGLGLYLAIELDCAYEGLRMLPLSPPLESSMVLAWKKNGILFSGCGGIPLLCSKMHKTHI